MWPNWGIKSLNKYRCGQISWKKVKERRAGDVSPAAIFCLSKIRKPQFCGRLDWGADWMGAWRRLGLLRQIVLHSFSCNLTWPWPQADQIAKCICKDGKVYLSKLPIVFCGRLDRGVDADWLFCVESSSPVSCNLTLAASWSGCCHNPQKSHTAVFSVEFGVQPPSLFGQIDDILSFWYGRSFVERQLGIWWICGTLTFCGDDRSFS